MDNNLEEQFNEIINDYKKTLREGVEEALTSSGNEAIRYLSGASPVGKSIPHFKDCWAMKTKYKGVRYVGNTDTTKEGIPISNLLEYSRNGHPFIANTFELSKNSIYNTFILKLGGKLK